MRFSSHRKPALLGRLKSSQLRASLLHQRGRTNSGMRDFHLDNRLAVFQDSNVMKTSIQSLIAVLAFICFSFLPKLQAVSPPPDGAYAGANTAEGENALFSLSTGLYNTAIGFFSLEGVKAGNFNTAVGAGALFANTGSENTATGSGALLNNTIGDNNTANGESALFKNSTGSANTAVGSEALFNNTTGLFNTAHGSAALFSNSSGSRNTAMGLNALSSNTTGQDNIAVGFGAGLNVITAHDTICIGNSGTDVSNTCFISQIFGVTPPLNDAVPVVIDSAGQLGTLGSARRLKKEIKPMDKASEAILALKPVTFQYKSNKTNRPEFGLIAEEVAAVNSDLVIRDKNGEIYTVRYDAVNAMLLNEFLKEHRKVQELTKDFQATVAQLTARLDEQAAQIQKVNAQLETSKPTPQIVNNP
jgi:Chaperone of endosialidase